MGDTLCLMSLDPMGPGQPPGFSTGYLIGCAVVLTVLVVELAVFALLQ
jgi:hypothetical protein